MHRGSCCLQQGWQCCCTAATDTAQQRQGALHEPHQSEHLRAQYIQLRGTCIGPCAPHWRCRACKMLQVLSASAIQGSQLHHGKC